MLKEEKALTVEELRPIARHVFGGTGGEYVGALDVWNPYAEGKDVYRYCPCVGRS